MGTDGDGVIAADPLEDDFNLPEGPPPWVSDIQLADPATIKLGGVYHLDPSLVQPDPDQPRTEFPEEEIRGLALGIWTHGQEECAHIYILDDGTPFLLNGERRHRACLLLSMPFMVIVKRKPPSRGRKLVQQVISNGNRKDLPELDEARSIRSMLDENIPIQEICRAFNKKRPWVEARLSLLKLVPQVQEMMSTKLKDHERLSVSKASEIAKAPQSHQLELAQSALKMTTTRARMMVRAATGKGQLASDVDRELRKRTPADDQRVIGAFLERIADTADDFFGFSEDKLNKLYSGLTPAKRRLARVKINRALNNIQRLGEKLLGLPSLQEGEPE